MELRDSILCTLAYFDTMDVGLRATEMADLLIKTGLSAPKPSSFKDIQEWLDILVKEGTIGLREGVYYMFDREYLAPLRQRKDEKSRLKRKKVRKIVRLLRHIPFIKAIFSAGSIASGNTLEVSDLDIKLILAKNRLWTTRFLLYLVLTPLGLIRRDDHVIAPDRICPSLYVAEDNLKISKPSLDKAITFIMSAPVLAVDDDVLRNYFEANQWVNDYIYGQTRPRKNWYDGSKLFKPSWLSKLGSMLLAGNLGAWLETKLRSIQVGRIESNPKTAKNRNRIVYSDKEISFHAASMDEHIIKPYHKKIIKLGIKAYPFKRDLEQNESIRHK